MVSGGLEPTIYELRGDGGTQVSYATINLQGRARLLYVGPTASAPIPTRRSTPATPSSAARSR
jgi:hypothetical protein